MLRFIFALIRGRIIGIILNRFFSVAVRFWRNFRK